MVGIKILEIENETEKDNLTLEVYCKHNIHNETKKDEFEIIFNDVTKARQIEEKISELIYKSIFLSKVSKEFKNPLICIRELVHQLSENYGRINETTEKLMFEEIHSKSIRFLAIK